MLKVLLLGDSIRLGYRDKVSELLKGRARVLGPDENCRFSAFTLFRAGGWASDGDYDLIQWNNGQWDTCYMPDGKIHTPLPQYLDNLERIASILKPRTRRLVFATTTPVWPEMFATCAVNPRRNEDIDRYNSEAVTLMEKINVEINDLNGPLRQDIRRYICDDMVHLTDEGADLCAKAVSELIAAPTRKGV